MNCAAIEIVAAMVPIMKTAMTMMTMMTMMTIIMTIITTNTMMNTKKIITMTIIVMIMIVMGSATPMIEKTREYRKSQNKINSIIRNI